jgi:hypothetical protein
MKMKPLCFSAKFWQKIHLLILFLCDDECKTTLAIVPLRLLKSSLLCLQGDRIWLQLHNGFLKEPKNTKTGFTSFSGKQTIAECCVKTLFTGIFLFL